MKPICFPFTYVSDSVVQALTTCFGNFIVYRPLAGEIPEQLRPWVEEGIIDIRVPVIEDQKDIEAVVKNYLSWADLHFDSSGLKLPFLKTWTDVVPFFSATSSSQVVADLKEQVRGKPASPAPEPLLAARLFLYFAQEFDRQNQEVARDLKRHQQQETELFQHLKMEDDDLIAEFQIEAEQPPDDSADYMAMDRLEAWTRLLLRDTDISGIFVTHSPDIYKDLFDKTPGAEKLFHFDSISTVASMTPELVAWQQKLVSGLAHIVEHKWSPTAVRLSDMPDLPAVVKTLSLRAFLAVDQNPRDFFSCCAQIEPSDSETHITDDRFHNTLIGLIELNE